MEIVKPVTQQLNDLSNKFILENIYCLTSNEEEMKNAAKILLRKALEDLEKLN